MAIKVTKSMLKRKYSWKAVDGDDPTKTDVDSRLLNRKEGYEVILMIQKVVDHFNYEEESDVHKIEDAIATSLPGNVRGQKKVFAWLVMHFS